MNQTEFAVSQFRNRNGTISWRVDGRLNGVRIRKNFKTREEAVVEKGTLELKAMQTEAGMRSVSTFLSETQLREAETASNRLKDHPRPLSFYVDYALSSRHTREDTGAFLASLLRPPARTSFVGTASATGSLGSERPENSRGPIRLAHVEQIANRDQHWPRHAFPDAASDRGRIRHERI